MRTFTTIIILNFSLSLCQGQGTDYEYFYHPKPAYVSFVCPDNGDYKMYTLEKFGSNIIDVEPNEIMLSMSGTPNYPVYSYNSSFCDIGIGSFSDYDYNIRKIMHIDDESSFTFDIYENETYPNDELTYRDLHTIDIPGPTYLFSYHEGGTHEADAEGSIVSTWSDILDGNFLRKNDDVYVLDIENVLFKFNLTTNMWDKIHEFTEDFDDIKAITYDDMLDKHYLLDGNLWELNIGVSDATATELIYDVIHFNIFGGIVYFTEKGNGRVVKSYNLLDETISDFYTSDPNTDVSFLSNNGEELLIGANFGIYSEHSLPLLQVVKIGSNYNPVRVDFTIENLDVQKQVNYHFIVDHAVEEFKNRANVDLTFTFDITNNGTETLTELTSYDDALFDYKPKMHNHQVLVDIAPGEKQTITYTRTTNVIATNTKVNVIVPGANYKLDRDLSDNSLEFDINLISDDLIAEASGIYPNPVADRLFFKDRSGLYSGQIFNNIGQLVYQFHDQDLLNGISVSELESGYHSIVLADKNGLNNTVHKFVKM